MQEIEENFCFGKISACRACEGIPATVAVGGDVILENGVLFNAPWTFSDFFFTIQHYGPCFLHLINIHFSYYLYIVSYRAACDLLGDKCKLSALYTTIGMQGMDVAFVF